MPARCSAQSNRPTSMQVGGLMVGGKPMLPAVDSPGPIHSASALDFTTTLPRDIIALACPPPPPPSRPVCHVALPGRAAALWIAAGGGGSPHRRLRGTGFPQLALPGRLLRGSDAVEVCMVCCACPLPLPQAPTPALSPTSCRVFCGCCRPPSTPSAASGGTIRSCGKCCGRRYHAAVVWTPCCVCLGHVSLCSCRKIEGMHAVLSSLNARTQFAPAAGCCASLHRWQAVAGGAPRCVPNSKAAGRAALAATFSPNGAP